MAPGEICPKRLVPRIVSIGRQLQQLGRPLIETAQPQAAVAEAVRQLRELADHLDDLGHATDWAPDADWPKRKDGP